MNNKQLSGISKNRVDFFEETKTEVVKYNMEKTVTQKNYVRLRSLEITSYQDYHCMTTKPIIVEQQRM